MRETLPQPPNSRWEGRVEDDRLIRGAGRFADDLHLPGQLVGVFVRSTHAHARLISVEVEAARRAAGVVAILTHADIAGLGSATRPAPLAPGRIASPLAIPFRPVLAGARVMHVGEAIALVVAESASAAEDAAELVDVDYEPLPAIVDAEEALRPGATQIHEDVRGNLAADWSLPEDMARAEAVDRTLAAAHRVVRGAFLVPRVAGVPIEPRGATAVYDEASDGFTFHGPSQGAGVLGARLAAVMGVPPERMRVLSDDVGGAFGLKSPPYPEYAALLAAARRLGRPVHWMSTRAEAFLSDHQGRDNHSHAALALDAEGRFLALKIDAVVNLGAYPTAAGAVAVTGSFAGCFPQMYAIPQVSVRIRLAYTNTIPTGPYRGAGRPESNYVMERIVEAAARETGITPADLRRRNLIPPSAMPFKTAIGKTYDSGDFAAVLDRALTASRFAEAGERKAASSAAGKLRGIGISCFLETAGGSPESVSLRFEGDRLVARLGVHSTGQGHATVFRNLLADRLGLARESVSVLQGDSAYGIKGGPAVGSRSAMSVGPALAKAADTIIAKGQPVAAAMFQAPEDSVSYAGGSYAVGGTDRRVSLLDVARTASAMAEAKEIAEDLDTVAEAAGTQTFPNGCHIAEVEIDPETGMTEILAYTAVDDCGAVLDEIIAEGQIAGGVAQGVGEVLLEAVRFDADGQLLTGSLMDYGVPRAETLPAILSHFQPAPAATNALGVKGVGEAGTTAALAAVMNAIIDAMPEGKGSTLQMPATPDKIWAALRR